MQAQWVRGRQTRRCWLAASPLTSALLSLSGTVAAYVASAVLYLPEGGVAVAHLQPPCPVIAHCRDLFHSLRFLSKLMISKWTCLALTSGQSSRPVCVYLPWCACNRGLTLKKTSVPPLGLPLLPIFTGSVAHLTFHLFGPCSPEPESWCCFSSSHRLHTSALSASRAPRSPASHPLCCDSSRQHLPETDDCGNCSLTFLPSWSPHSAWMCCRACHSLA